MEKKKLVFTSLASIAILGAGLYSSHHLIVSAAEAVESVSEKEQVDLKLKLADIEKGVLKAIESDKSLTTEEVAKIKVQVMATLNEAKELIKDPASLAEFINKIDEHGNLTSPIRTEAENGLPAKKDDILKADEEEELARLKEFMINFSKKEIDKTIEKRRNKKKPATTDNRSLLSLPELKDLKLSEKRTEWVLKTSSEEIVAISAPEENLERDFSDFEDAMLEEGYSYKNTETVGMVTRHIYTTVMNTPTVSHTEETRWFDVEGHLLFKVDGLQDKNFKGIHDALTKKGYVLLEGGTLDDGRHNDLPNYSKDVRGFLYERKYALPDTAPTREALPEYPLSRGDSLSQGGSGVAPTRDDFPSYPLPTEAQSEATKPTASEANISPRTTEETAKASLEEKAEPAKEAPKKEEAKKAELPQTGMADSFGTIGAAVTSLVAGLGISFTGKKKQ